MRIPVKGAVATARVPTELGIAAGFATVATACLIITWLLPPPATTARFIVLCAVLVSFGAIVRNLAAALATAGMALPFYLGFLLDRLGELHWHGQVDLARLAALLAAAAAGTVAGRLITRARPIPAVLPMLPRPRRSQHAKEESDV
jgi:hypothetical protein